MKSIISGRCGRPLHGGRAGAEERVKTASVLRAESSLLDRLLVFVYRTALGSERGGERSGCSQQRRPGGMRSKSPKHHSNISPLVAHTPFHTTIHHKSVPPQLHSRWPLQPLIVNILISDKTSLLFDDDANCIATVSETTEIWRASAIHNGRLNACRSIIVPIPSGWEVDVHAAVVRNQPPSDLFDTVRMPPEKMGLPISLGVRGSFPGFWIPGNSIATPKVSECPPESPHPAPPPPPNPTQHQDRWQDQRRRTIASAPVRDLRPAAGLVRIGGAPSQVGSPTLAAGRPSSLSRPSAGTGECQQRCLRGRRPAEEQSAETAEAARLRLQGGLPRLLGGPSEHGSEWGLQERQWRGAQLADAPVLRFRE